MKRNPKRRLIALTAAALLAVTAVAQENVPEAPDKTLSDRAVADALEMRILLDRAVNLNDIDVRVTEGVAQLTGTVDNLLARRRATYLAEMVRGVRAVSNRIRVAPDPVRWDTDVRRDVIHALLTDPATDSYEITVAVEDGKVTLTGTVDSWAEQDLCARVAMGVRGVVEVVPALTVERKLDRPDTEIKPEVVARLRWDVLVEDGLIDVEVNEGRVTLSGTVGSAAERRKAENDAWVAGVRSVDSSGLRVRPWADDEDLKSDKYAEKSPEEIRDAIKWAALYDPRVKSFHIEPSVDLGWVTLRGTVDNLKAKRAAERLARHTVGVVGVTNQLKVRASDGETRDDREIRSDIRGALRVDPYTDSAEIVVRVQDGVATLSGTVEDHFERAQAEDVASRTRGVREIRNRLKVNGATVYVQPELSYPWYPAVTPVPEAERTGRELREAVRVQLLWCPFVDDSEVQVSVEGSSVTLKGTVDSWRAYHAATDQAYEGGAVTVINKLEVR